MSNNNCFIFMIILIISLNDKAQAKYKNRKFRILSQVDRPQELPNPPGIILIRPKLDLTKALELDANDISMILSSSEETDPSDQFKQALRQNAGSSDSENYNSTEMETLVFLPNNTHKYIKTAEVIDSSFEDVTDGMKGQSLRGREELKCIDACAEVLNNVCDSHNCGVKERHVFRRQCLTACRSRF